MSHVADSLVCTNIVRRAPVTTKRNNGLPGSFLQGSTRGSVRGRGARHHNHPRAKLHVVTGTHAFINVGVGAARVATMAMGTLKRVIANYRSLPLSSSSPRSIISIVQRLAVSYTSRTVVTKLPSPYTINISLNKRVASSSIAAFTPFLR